MRRLLIVALIVANCLLMAGAVYIFPVILRAGAAIAEQAQLTQQAHERLDVLERALRINTTPGPSRGPKREVVQMVVTAYTAGPESTGKSPGHPAYGITSTGRRLTQADRFKVAAADPKYWPPGTRFYFPNFGWVEIADTGSAVKGPDRIDVFFGMGENPMDVAECYRWGVRKMGVVVLR